MNMLHTIAVERAGLPRVTIAQRVIDKMVHGALIYQTETGESLIGLPVQTAGRIEPDLFVLDTIAPDNSAVRRGAYFEQGDDLQGDIFNWLYDNWNAVRGKVSEPRWNVPLSHLGDWHKHPGTLTEPSWGDTDTALDHVLDKEAGKPYLLAILATVWDRQQAHISDEFESLILGESPIKVDIDESTTIRLDCWYMGRRTRRFVHLTPTVQPDAALPNLPPVSWHLSTPARVNQEVETLSNAGYAVSLEEFDADGQPPRELCLTLARRGGERILIVITQADYPRTMPTIRTVPMKLMSSIPEGADLFKALWDASLPLPPAAYPTWDWNADRTIYELAQAVEEKVTNP